MTRLIATFFYVGLLPKAPGTWGSLAALPVAVLLHAIGGFWLLLAATIAVFFIGWWATAQETKDKDNHDPSEIVIDEVAGQWIPLLTISYVLTSRGMDILLPWPALVFGFLFFRLFDIFKPWPVSWADRKSTPLGVMLDDIIAGILALICVTILGGLFHGLLI